MIKRIALLMSVLLIFTMTGCELVRKHVTIEEIPVEDGSSEASSEENSSEDATSSEQSSDSSTQSSSQAPTVSGNQSTVSSNTPSAGQPDNGGTGSSSTANLDKPFAKDPGALGSTMPDGYESQFDDKAAEMRNSVLNAKDVLKATGTTYYISPNGNDNNNGTSKSTPWKTLSKLNANQSAFKKGDVVLLERGGIYRTGVNINLVSGVSYGAYGTGDKPCVYGSVKNYAKSEWKSLGGNLWQINAGLGNNVGIIVFNHGEQTGYLRLSKSELKKNYDFYTGDGLITLYLDKNPKEAFYSIEMSNAIRLFDMGSGTSDITIENICFKYTGGHAVRGSACSNIIVRGLEIGYVGGSILTGYGNGETRFGNGVELMGASKNVLVENNWIYQIYDSGVTHQGDPPKNGTSELNTFVIRNNLIEYCGMGSIEYWHTKGLVMTNVTYEGNLMRYAGYGFGGTQRPDKNMTGHIMSNGKPGGASYNEGSNFVIKNNIFELSTYQLVNATSAAKTPPILSGNTYVQWQGKWLGYYENVTNEKFGTNALNTIKSKWGDSDAKVIFAE